MVKSKTCDLDPKDQEPDAFCRYLCPSSSDEEDCEKKPVDSVPVDGKLEAIGWLSTNKIVR